MAAAIVTPDFNRGKKPGRPRARQDDDRLAAISLALKLILRQQVETAKLVHRLRRTLGISLVELEDPTAGGAS